MRTTIDIPDVLYRAVRSRTASEGTTLRHITIALLGDWMQHPDWHPKTRPEIAIVDAPPKPKSRLPFLGFARKGANMNVSHNWADIKKTIEDGWTEEALAKEEKVIAP